MAYDELLKELREKHNLEPIVASKSTSTGSQSKPAADQQQTSGETSADQSAYTELIELTQRKFLRQMGTFTDTATSSRPFPRLFTLDFATEMTTNSTTADAASSATPSMSTSTSASTVDAKSARYCLRGLCESDSGWHPTGTSIAYELLADIPDTHYAYLIRVLNLIKHSAMNLPLLHAPVNTLDDIITYLETNLDDMNKKTTTPSMMMSRTRQADPMMNFRESYNGLKAYVMSKLAASEAAAALSSNVEENPNRVESLRLSRCSLPSGKIAWLCDEHSREQYVQLLTSVESSSGAQFQNDEYSAILLEELKKYKN